MRFSWKRSIFNFPTRGPTIDSVHATESALDDLGWNGPSHGSCGAFDDR